MQRFSDECQNVAKMSLNVAPSKPWALRSIIFFLNLVPGIFARGVEFLDFDFSSKNPKFHDSENKKDPFSL